MKKEHNPSVANKIYRVKNKANNAILVVAKNTKDAVDISLSLRFAKNPKNVRVVDITKEYLEGHKKLKKVPEQTGQLFKIIENNKESWSVFFMHAHIHTR